MHYPVILVSVKDPFFYIYIKIPFIYVYIYVCVSLISTKHLAILQIYRNTFTHCWKCKCLRGLTQLLVSPQHRYRTIRDNSGTERSTPRTHSCKGRQKPR